nr:hypothetical protein [uncultured Treponema sp.]
MLTSASQLSNARSPISVTLSGISTVSRAEQYRKQYASILVTFFGILMLLSVEGLS